MYSATLSNPWSMGLLMLFLGMLAGYAVGRRIGHREGVAFGLALAPLDLRREAWQEGECAICGTKSADGLGPAATDTSIDFQESS